MLGPCLHTLLATFYLSMRAAYFSGLEELMPDSCQHQIGPTLSYSRRRGKPQPVDFMFASSSDHCAAYEHAYTVLVIVLTCCHGQQRDPAGCPALAHCATIVQPRYGINSSAVYRRRSPHDTQ